MSFISSIFYTATTLALIFFIHKVLWLVRYKQIQSALVERAVLHLRDGNSAAMQAWEELSSKAWSSIAGDTTVESPVHFVDRVEKELAKFRAEIKASRRSIENTLVKALAEGKGTPDLVAALVLSLRRLSKTAKDRIQVTIDLSFPEVIAPGAPDPKLYELNVKSRYTMLRRALVFFSGAADVVYSSQHVAMMSQNAHVPLSLLVRRLSLVFLIIGAVLLDWILGLRTALAAWINDLLGYHPNAPGAGFLEENLGSALAFGVWLACYGSVYLLAYFSIRRRYQSSVRQLRDMQSHEADRLRQIRQRHLDELVFWAREYARGLDNAVEITLRHADTLVDHCAHRVRRRVVAQSLLDGARTVADALFKQLPESLGGLQDAATTHKHSLAHYIWPRPEEMEYQVKLTQLRAAWQHLELSMTALRSERPDPREAHELWRSVVAYSTMFERMVPEGTAEGLKGAYRKMVMECVDQTDKDLEDLDKRLVELAKSLNEQLASARPLVESKVELANQHIVGAMAAHSAEIIRVREQARLEAMAFEI